MLYLALLLVGVVLIVVFRNREKSLRKALRDEADLNLKGLKLVADGSRATFYLMALIVFAILAWFVVLIVTRTVGAL